METLSRLAGAALTPGERARAERLEIWADVGMEAGSARFMEQSRTEAEAGAREITYVEATLDHMAFAAPLADSMDVFWASVGNQTPAVRRIVSVNRSTKAVFGNASRAFVAWATCEHPERVRAWRDAVSPPSPADCGGSMSASNAVIAGLDPEIDDRDRNPDASRHRLARFRIGWADAVRGDTYSAETLRTLTWNNLGWRLGMLLGDASEENVERMYRLCVTLQAEQ